MRIALSEMFAAALHITVFWNMKQVNANKHTHTHTCILAEGMWEGKTGETRLETQIQFPHSCRRRRGFE